MKININSPIGGTGYGVAGLNIVKELDKNHDVTLFPIGNPVLDSQNDYDLIYNCISRQENFDYNAPYIKIWHQFDLSSKHGNGKYFAYPFFEITKLNNREIHHLNFPDEIIVSSSWAKQILESNNINRKINVVPLGVDRSVFNPDNFTSDSVRDKYIFITIGKWEKRKSHDIIIELFEKAFNANDSVELWMLTHNPFLNQEQESYWTNLVLNSSMRHKIKIFPRLQSHAEVAKVISYAHCGIYISRAEGWNLDLLETLSMGKPVIVTNYSAHTEFCNKNNSFLVDIDHLEPASDDMWFNGFGEWAKIDQQQKDQIIEYMRYVFQNKITTNHPGIETAKNFTWKNSADKLLRCILS